MAVMHDFAARGREDAVGHADAVLALMVAGSPFDAALWWQDFFASIVPARMAELKAEGASEDHVRSYVIALAETVLARIESVQESGTTVQ